MWDAFDPYRKWLGIPPAEQPSHARHHISPGGKRPLADRGVADERVPAVADRQCI